MKGPFVDRFDYQFQPGGVFDGCVTLRWDADDPFEPGATTSKYRGPMTLLRAQKDHGVSLDDVLGSVAATATLSHDVQRDRADAAEAAAKKSADDAQSATAAAERAVATAEGLRARLDAIAEQVESEGVHEEISAAAQ